MGPAGRVDVVLVAGGRWHDFDYARLQLLTALAEHPAAKAVLIDWLVAFCSDISPPTCWSRTRAMCGPTQRSSRRW